MEPDAPAVLSTTMVWPSVFCMAPANSRVMVSPGPPGAYGMTMVMGRDGKSCAPAWNAARLHMAARLASARRRGMNFMVSPAFVGM